MRRDSLFTGIDLGVVVRSRGVGEGVEGGSVCGQRGFTYEVWTLIRDQLQPVCSSEGITELGSSLIISSKCLDVIFSEDVFLKRSCNVVVIVMKRRESTTLLFLFPKNEVTVTEKGSG